MEAIKRYAVSSAPAQRYAHLRVGCSEQLVPTSCVPGLYSGRIGAESLKPTFSTLTGEPAPCLSVLQGLAAAALHGSRADVEELVHVALGLLDLERQPGSTLAGDEEALVIVLQQLGDLGTHSCAGCWQGVVVQ